MDRAGFVLAGGRSSRMGRDKALLRIGQQSLLERIAQTVSEAAGWVGLIGAPERYRELDYPSFPDRNDGCGPLGGLETALGLQKAPWNLIVGCDMPGLEAEPLRRLLAAIPENPQERSCVVAVGPAGPEPLCAVYHVSCAAAVGRAIEAKRFKMKELLTHLRTVPVSGFRPEILANVNTPSEWVAWKGETKR